MFEGLSNFTTCGDKYVSSRWTGWGTSDQIGLVRLRMNTPTVIMPPVQNAQGSLWYEAQTLMLRLLPSCEVARDAKYEGGLWRR